jgi:uncharacterized DUF497 family protein
MTQYIKTVDDSYSYAWDEEKSERCLAERGFGFDFAAEILEFSDPTIQWVDRRRDYGEVRLITVGEIDGNVYAVVWTVREHERRIISARIASRKERELLNGNRS